MFARSARPRVVPALLAAGCVTVTVLVPTAAGQSTGAPERYSATAINMGSGFAGAGRVFINVQRWSTPQEREALLKIFVEKGPQDLLRALQKNRSTGTIRLPTTLAWDLRYAFQSPLPEGGRRVVLATDRPIGFQEARNRPRTIDYPFTLIEIHFDRAGVGTGKMSVFTKISLSKDKQTMELENFGIEPTRLTEVTIEK